MQQSFSVYLTSVVDNAPALHNFKMTSDTSAIAEPNKVSEAAFGHWAVPIGLSFVGPKGCEQVEMGAHICTTSAMTHERVLGK